MEKRIRILEMSRLIGSISVVCMMVNLGCNGANFTEKTRCDPNKSVRYFKTFAAYDLPIRPVEEMSVAEVNEISARYSYDRALYDETGKLVGLHEIFDNKIKREIKYFYDANDMVVKCEIRRPCDADYGISEEYYDESGDLTKIKRFDSRGVLVEERIRE